MAYPAAQDLVGITQQVCNARKLAAESLEQALQQSRARLDGRVE